MEAVHTQTSLLSTQYAYILMDEEMGDIELGDLDLVGLEDACKNNTFQDIAPKQIQMLTDILHNAKANKKLSIVTTTPKETKKGTKKSKKRGRKTALKRIANMGTILVESGQYSQLTEIFPLNPTVNQ